MILAIETSDIVCSVALWDAEKKQTILESNLELPMQHATLLASVVENALRFVEQTISDNLGFEKKIELVAVSVGPGSFTGLRIGLSFAQGFCFANRLPIVGISNHQVLAKQVRRPREQLYTMIDARREEVYLAKLEFSPEGYPEIVEHDIVLRQRLPEVLQSGAVLVKPFFHELDAEILQKLKLKGVTVHYKGEYLARLIANLGHAKFKKYGADDLKKIEPLYIRPFAGVQ
ncbi:tRNA (adenosine(37)-N6)-threonylcarbamoyltransferase complex dimerization subunit type 1 TsaB [Caldithrix abyssi]